MEETEELRDPVKSFFKNLNNGNINYSTANGTNLKQKFISILKKRVNSQKWKNIHSEDKADIIQEIHIAVDQGINQHNFYDEINFEKWVNRIATYKFINYCRKKESNKYTKDINDDDFNEASLINNSSDSPDNIVEYIEQIINELIMDGKIKLAEAIQTYYEVIKEGIDDVQDEAAKRIGISKRTLQRYKDEVREYIKKKGINF